MRFMTYNIQIAVARAHNPKWNPKLFDLSGVAEVIASQSPDVVALQEVDRRRSRSAYVDQTRWLGERLGYHYAHAPAYGEIQENGSNGEYGNALLSRYPIADFKIINLDPGTTEPAPGHRWIEPRCIFIARLEAETPINVMGLHLSTVFEQRIKPLEQVADLVEAHADLPTVLMGDFNATHEELNGTRLPKLLDNLLASNPIPTFPNGEAARTCIDHIWVSRDWRVKAVWVVSERLGRSDHNPVVADLELPEE